MTARLHHQNLRGAFAACRRGNVAILFALFLPVIVGGAGFGVETTYWYYKRLALQAAADSAAYSAALEKRGGGDSTEVTTVAKLTVSQNGFTEPATTIQVNPQSVNGGGSVEVVLTDKAERFFTGIFMDSDPVIVTRATATYNNASSACILALSPTASKAANFSGSSTLTLTGCSVMSNSNAVDSFNIQGAALMTTTCVIAVGGAHVTSGLTMSQCSSPITNAPSVADPYADVPVPPKPSCGGDDAPNNKTIDATKAYCAGLTLKGNIVMRPGIYYVEGDFKVSSNANVTVGTGGTGDGVTIYTKSGTIDIPSNGTVNLKAPTTGTYAGVLFFVDRAVTGQSKFNGTADSKLTGAIYSAGGAIQYNGNFSGLNGCTQVVGSTVEWTGNTTVSVDCSAYGMRTLPVLTVVRLTA
jgi:Flp pilus assembly protein TadG